MRAGDFDAVSRLLCSQAEGRTIRHEREAKLTHAPERMDRHWKDRHLGLLADATIGHAVISQST